MYFLLNFMPYFLSGYSDSLYLMKQWPHSFFVNALLWQNSWQPQICALIVFEMWNLLRSPGQLSCLTAKSQEGTGRSELSRCELTTSELTLTHHTADSELCDNRGTLAQRAI